MIRLACLLGLVAVAIIAAMAIHPTGPTAILFSFVGVPVLGLSIVIFGIKRWRDGALSWNREI